MRQHGRGVTPAFPPQENNQEEVLEGRKGDRSVSWQGRKEPRLGKGHPQETVREVAGNTWVAQWRTPCVLECVCVKWGPGEGVAPKQTLHSPCLLWPWFVPPGSFCAPPARWY